MEIQDMVGDVERNIPDYINYEWEKCLYFLELMTKAFWSEF